MIKQTKELYKNIPYWVKLVSSILAVTITLGGAVLAMEDRYVSEKEEIKTLQIFNSNIQQNFRLMNLKIFQLQYDHLTDSYYQYKKLRRNQPIDIEIQEEFERIKNERKLIKEKINKLLEERNK